MHGRSRDARYPCIRGQTCPDDWCETGERRLQGHPRPVPRAVSEADLAQRGTVYQLGLPPRRIDVLTAVDGVTFDEAWAGRVVVEVGALHVPFIGAGALVRNKQAAGRAKDLLALELLAEAQAASDDE